MSQPRTKTLHLRGSDAHHNDWATSRAWRRMFLALTDKEHGSPEGLSVVLRAARVFADLAVQYAGPEADRLVRLASGFRQAPVAYRVISESVDLLARACPHDDVEGALCDYVRAIHPEPPVAFLTTGTHTRGQGSGPFVPTRHKVVSFSR